MVVRHGRSPEMGGTAWTVLHSLGGFIVRLQSDAGTRFTNMGLQRWAIPSGWWWRSSL
jgi:hypothetical protein